VSAEVSNQENDNIGNIRTAARAAISESRSNYIRQRFDEAAGDCKTTWRATNDVLHRGRRTYHSDDECRLLSSKFATFFVDKLHRVQRTVADRLMQSPAFDLPNEPPVIPPPSRLFYFAPVTVSEVRKLLTPVVLKSSLLDVLSSALLHSSADVFAPIIAHMANLSFSEGCFPATFKTAQVLPLLKKPGLDKEAMNNYRPISNLTTISKLLERLVLSKFRPHLTQSPSFSHLQSA